MQLVRSALLAGVVGLAGCATIIDGTTSNIVITTEPPGARVTINDGAEHMTPTGLKLTRGKAYTLVVSKEGFHSERVKIRNTLNPWVFGNIVFGGLIGLAVDLLSGAVTDLTPTKVHIALQALRPSERPEIRDWSPPKQSPKEKPQATAPEAAK